jgi:hypothetical protein
MESDPKHVLYAQAVFASWLATGSHPVPADIVAAIAGSAARFAVIDGCADVVAREYGDHPDLAVTRMRWALELVRNMPLTGVSDGAVDLVSQVS